MPMRCQAGSMLLILWQHGDLQKEDGFPKCHRCDKIDHQEAIPYFSVFLFLFVFHKTYKESCIERSTGEGGTIMSVMTELKKVWKLLSESTNIPVLLLAGSIATIGGGFLSPILSYYFREQGISFVGLGIIASSASLVSLALRPLIGYFSDKFGRKIIIVGSFLLLSVLTPFYLIIRNVVGLAVVHSSRSVVSEASQPALSAMIGDVAPKEGRATLFGFYSSVDSIAYSAALFGGGAILAVGFQLKHLFYITSGCLFISTVLLALFLKETVKKEKKPEKLPSPEIRLEEPVGRLEKFFMSVIAMIADRNSLGLLLYSFFFMFALAVYPFYIPLFAIEVFGAGKALLGPIIAVSWITFAIIQPYGGWLSDAMGKRKILITLGLTLIVIFNTLMAVSPTLAWMVVFWALIGIGDGMFRPVMNALIVDIVPAATRGTYFGTLGSMRGIASIIAPLVYGLVAEIYGIRWTFQITSVCFVCAMLTVAIFIKEGRVIGEQHDL